VCAPNPFPSAISLFGLTVESIKESRGASFIVNNWNNKCSRKGSQLKLKGLKNGNKKNVYEIFSLKMLNNYNIVGLKNNLLLSMKVHYKVIRLDYLII
jgi:hypothetical protein